MQGAGVASGAGVGVPGAGGTGVDIPGASVDVGRPSGDIGVGVAKGLKPVHETMNARPKTPTTTQPAMAMIATRIVSFLLNIPSLR
jgi:hypothetical protein